MSTQRIKYRYSAREVLLSGKGQTQSYVQDGPRQRLRLLHAYITAFYGQIFSFSHVVVQSILKIRMVLPDQLFWDFLSKSFCGPKWFKNPCLRVQMIDILLKYIG